MGNAIQLLFPPPLNPGGALPTGLQRLLTNPGTTLMAFPFIFPGAYSKPQRLTNDQLGWIHSPTPEVNFNGGVTFQGNANGTTLDYLNNLNHNPLDLGDNLPVPLPNNGPYDQTWWGFPTWRETLSPNWTDPTFQVNVNVSQPIGLAPRTAKAAAIADDGHGLPWMSTPGDTAHGGPLAVGYDYSIVRRNPQLFSDAQAYKTMSVFLGAGGNVSPLWSVSWEDDLLMTGVRSFDVKAYDNAFAGYADLGWGDDLRLYLPYQNFVGYTFPAALPHLVGTSLTQTWPPVATGFTYNTVNGTLAHEGRMPPMIEDGRFDPNNGNTTYAGFAYTGNIGDDNSGVVRMRRIWDTWSIEYTQAPSSSLDNTTGFQTGPVNGSPPIYPSYPPPYPVALRGIQIQIRVADPANQRVKSLTIRQDFTDKL